MEKLDVSHDGSMIASISHDECVKFWSIKYLEVIFFVDFDKVHNARNPYQNVFNLDRKSISSGPISDLGIFDELFESQ